MQFKTLSEQTAELERIFARDRLDSAKVLRELVDAFIARFAADHVQFPLVVDHRASEAAPPPVVPVPPEYRFTRKPRRPK